MATGVVVLAVAIAGCRGPQETVVKEVPVTCLGGLTLDIPMSIELSTWVMQGENLEIRAVAAADASIPRWEMELTIPGATPETVMFTKADTATPQLVRVSPDATGSVDVHVSDFNPDVDGAIWDCEADTLFASIPVRARPSS